MPAPSQLSRRQMIYGAGAASAALLAGSRVRATVAGVATDPDALLRQRWDHVIVGGGSAGCVLARRLSEDRGVRVLLLEAGSDVRDPAVASPPAWPTLAGGAYDWRYQSTPQPGLDGRSVPEPRGKGLGGSTLINALGFQRGPHEAYDRWADETGDPGWGFAGLLPYFRRLETTSGGASEWRGGSGPLQVLEVGRVADRNPFASAFADGAVACGHAPNPDWNGARADGTIWTQLTIRDGRRDTAASAFLDPVCDRPNLAIVTGAQVLRGLIRRGRCEGVELLIDGRRRKVVADETIFSAGAFDSPRLLLLSGVGDADRLRKLGIAVQAPVPGVGRNLKDHPLVAGLLYRAKRPMPATVYNHCDAMVIAQSSGSPGWADLQLMCLDLPFLLPHIGQAPPNSFSIVPCLMAPRSSGELSITSDDPLAPALIDPGYLSDAADVDALVEALALAREIAAAPAMRDWVADEVFPGAAVTDKATLAAHVRRSASPFFHPVSTCRMGREGDPQTVVDPSCRVVGVDRLRVVDASIFPSIPQAMTNAATLAVAERAADLIAGKRQPARR